MKQIIKFLMPNFIKCLVGAGLFFVCSFNSTNDILFSFVLSITSLLNFFIASFIVDLIRIRKEIKN